MFHNRALITVSTCLFMSAALPAQDLTEELYKKVVRSAVFIVTPAGRGIGMGSGSLVDREQKIIITNYHVVRDNEWVFVQFPVDDEKGNMITEKKKYLARIREDKALKATVLKTDISRDLAILKVDSPIPASTPVLPLATKEPGKGAQVWNVGSPGAVGQVFSITEGTVRAIAKEKFLVGGGDPKDNFEINCRMITTTNPANPGDSGGPLVNSKGEMVGVTQSGKTSAELVSSFVDVSEVKAFLKENKIEVKYTPPVVEKKKEPDPKAKDMGTPKETTPSKDGPTPAQEKAATDALRLAKVFANSEDNRERYIDKLTEIVKKYPGTASAKEAKRLLDGLKK